MSIRLKLLAGCLCLTLMTILVGVLAENAQRRIGGLSTQLYDKALVSTSALSSAQGSLIRLEAEFRSRRDDGENGRLSQADAEHVGAELAAVEAELTVASDGAISQPGREVTDQARRRLAQLAASGAAVTPRLLLREVGTANEELKSSTRIFGADAYDVKGAVGTMVDGAIASTWSIVAFTAVLTFAVAYALSRAIVPALRQAVSVARAIADGQLSNDIRAPGRGETGELLSALASMQDSIARHYTDYETRVSSQADAFDGEIQLQHARFEAALDTMSQGLCMFDSKGRLVVVNRRFGEIFGDEDLEIGAALSEVAARLALRPVLGPGARKGLFTHQMDDGRVLAVSRQAVAAGGQVVTVEDVTERHRAAERLSHIASHDALTGLPNRFELRERMGALFRDPKAAALVSVLCLDLGGFKGVNETCGHSVGDALLIRVAARLSELCAEGDMLARLGGDDFAILRPLGATAADMEALARAVVSAVTEPFHIEGHRLSMGVAIGIALGAAGPAQPADALLKKAELALANARAGGGTGWRFFEIAMEEEVLGRRRTEIELGAALENDEFEIAYQPVIDVANRRISGFEALLRWRHPKRGIVSPAEFVPIAESTGLIQPIGLFVLEQACRQAAGWPSDLSISVNLSPVQFRAGTLQADVAGVLTRTGIEASRLQLEVTESVFLHASEDVLTTLKAFRRLGIRIAMDDFGTGYSSLGYLSRFPFDKVKIDQSFVRDLGKRENMAVVRAVLGLSKAMGLGAIAEGVETRRQVEMLLDEGCREMQGYHFGRPMPAAELPRFMMQFAFDRDEAAPGRGAISSLR